MIISSRLEHACGTVDILCIARRFLNERVDVCDGAFCHVYIVLRRHSVEQRAIWRWMSDIDDALHMVMVAKDSIRRMAYLTKVRLLF